MADPVDRIRSDPTSYTQLMLPRSLIGASAHRATEALARYDNRSRETSDLARWEGEGGADNPRAAAPKTLRKLITIKSAMSERSNH